MGLTKRASKDKIITSDPGALGAEETRQSIPNLAVKLCCGDNTAGGALWEDSSAPGPLQSQAILPNASNLSVWYFSSALALPMVL